VDGINDIKNTYLNIELNYKQKKQFYHFGFNLTSKKKEKYNIRFTFAVQLESCLRALIHYKHANGH